MFKRCTALYAALLLAACGVPETRPPAERAAPVAIGGRPAPAARAVHYRLDPAQSELRVLVHRAGPMARFGHNHVIVNRALDGILDLPDDPAAAVFSLQVPVAEFVVDDAAARAAEGADFAADVPEDARAGTRHNMLGAALLDGGHYPVVSVRSLEVLRGPEPGRFTGTLAVSIAGHESVIEVPFDVDITSGRVTVTGEAVLRQSQLGLTPFSIFLGAVAVADEVIFKWSLVALAV